MGLPFESGVCFGSKVQSVNYEKCNVVYRHVCQLGCNSDTVFYYLLYLKISCYIVPCYNRTTLHRIFTSRGDHHVNSLKIFLFLSIIPDVLYWCPCTPTSPRLVRLCLAHVTYAELRRTVCDINLLLLLKHGGSRIYPTAITSTNLERNVKRNVKRKNSHVPSKTMLIHRGWMRHICIS